MCDRDAATEMGEPGATHASRLEMTRRQVLRLLAAGSGAALLPAPLLRRALAGTARAASPLPFLSAQELAILDAATAVIVPTDGQPGARECGVIDYIQSLLSYMPGSDANCDRHVNAADVAATILALDGPRTDCPDGGDVDGNGLVDSTDVSVAESAVFRARPVFAGGPFSGRQPQPHFDTGSTPCEVCHGIAGAAGSASGMAAAAGTVDNYPPDSFREFLALPRLRRLSWKIRILGASAVPEAADNPLASSSLEVDLRNKYRVGLTSLDDIAQQTFGKRFVQLSTTQQSQVLDKADADFVTLLHYHTVEGILCAPEYGGNRDRIGWQLVGFDGDSQPLGYTLYDESTGQYRERPDKPNSGPNPDENCHGFSAGMNAFLTVISSDDFVKPGGPLTAPYCFEVPM